MSFLHVPKSWLSVDILPVFEAHTYFNFFSHILPCNLEMVNLTSLKLIDMTSICDLC